MTETHKDAIVDAVLYAMRSGCFFPVPEPKPGASVRGLVKWGAMRNLHRAVAEADRQAGRNAPNRPRGGKER